MKGRAALRRWFADRRRAYPWRGARDPYRILVSEVMLQQTQATRVVPAYRAFVRRFPTIRALAAASGADVLRAWGGLGYNRRAVSLHEAARMVIVEQGGRLPAEPADLRRLPGVGPYTAAAVASIAFGVPAPAVDTNGDRVVRRFVLGRDDAGGREIDRAAEAWLDRRDPGGWNQAVMDLGREVCRPVPRCEVCSLARMCAFRLSGATTAPRRPRQSQFEGSSRQLRGAVVRILRDREQMTLGTLATVTGRPGADVATVVRGLAAEGLIRAGPAALQGDARGRVRL
ncbi:MAG: A/G-specific adenine glycosylase [Actinomycetota bacterium]